MKWRDVIISWDLWLAAAGAFAAWWFLPPWTANTLAKELYTTGTSVLSIVFAVFFTALAVVAASGADDFVVYLREIGIYDGILQTYRFTLILLFVALLASVVLFAFTAISQDLSYSSQARAVPVAFSFLFLYSLFAVIWSTNDSIEYAKRRVLYTEWKLKSGPGTVTPKPSADPAPSTPSE